MSVKMLWEHFPHEADVGVRGLGTSLEEAFSMAALSLTALVANPEKIQRLQSIPITCKAPNQEILFYDWLNAIIYEMDVRNMLFSGFDLHIHKNQLEGTLSGEPVDIKRHQPTVYIKGATLTELRVEKKGDLWLAQCVVDV